MKKKVWKYLALSTLIALAIPGAGSVANLPTPDTGALYLILTGLFSMLLLLVWEYTKARNYNEAIRDVLSDVLQDNDRKYQYLRLDGNTCFYLDAGDVIRLIEEERVKIGPEGLVKLAEMYRDSPKISRYFKQILRVRLPE